jgi:hypothetical protein
MGGPRGLVSGYWPGGRAEGAGGAEGVEGAEGAEGIVDWAVGAKSGVRRGMPE